jgi:hypothetical protein
MTRGDNIGVVQLGWQEGQMAMQRQHFGKAIKAATSCDKRNNIVNNLVTIQKVGGETY